MASSSPRALGYKRQSQEFMAWLVQKPGVKVNRNILIADLVYPDTRRGILVTDDIPEGEELFTIPRDLVLTTNNSKLKTLLPKELERLDEWQSLILVLIYEFLSGGNSAWAPYLRILPREFHTLMFWSDYELRELQGSAVINKIGKKEAEEDLLQGVAPIIRGNSSLFPPIDGLSSYDGDAGTEAILRLSHIMGSLIMAYAFDLDEGESEENDGEDGYVTDDEEQSSKGMVPLADLLNADPVRHNARLDQEENCLVMRATKFIESGNQIFDDYGEFPRSDLLRRHGCVTDAYAPYDVVELSLESICQAAGLEFTSPETLPQIQFLDKFEVIDDGYDITRPQSKNSLESIIPEELVVLVRTLALSPEQLQHQMSKSKPPKPALGTPEVTILRKAVQAKCANYETTIPQDLEILGRLNELRAKNPLDTFSWRQRLAVQVRLGEKEILQNVMGMLDSYLTGHAEKRNADDDDHDSRNTKAQKN